MKTAICANVDEQELPWTQFGCFDFEDLTVLGDKLLLFNSDGISEYGGGTDNGVDIGAWFEIATTDFNVLNQKRLRAILGSAVFSGDMIISVKFDDGGFEGYHIVEDKDLDSYAFKRTINRAQKGCHVTIRFNNVAGSDFSVDAVDAIVLLLHNKPIGLGYEKASTAFLGHLQADITLAEYSDLWVMPAYIDAPNLIDWPKLSGFTSISGSPTIVDDVEPSPVAGHDAASMQNLTGSLSTITQFSAIADIAGIDPGDQITFSFFMKKQASFTNYPGFNIDPHPVGVYNMIVDETMGTVTEGFVSASPDATGVINYNADWWRVFLTVTLDALDSLLNLSLLPTYSNDGENPGILYNGSARTVAGFMLNKGTIASYKVYGA